MVNELENFEVEQAVVVMIERVFNGAMHVGLIIVFAFLSVGYNVCMYACALPWWLPRGRCAKEDPGPGSAKQIYNNVTLAVRIE